MAQNWPNSRSLIEYSLHSITNHASLNSMPSISNAILLTIWLLWKFKPCEVEDYHLCESKSWASASGLYPTALFKTESPFSKSKAYTIWRLPYRWCGFYGAQLSTFQASLDKWHYRWWSGRKPMVFCRWGDSAPVLLQILETPPSDSQKGGQDQYSRRHYIQNSISFIRLAPVSFALFTVRLS